MRFSYTSGPWYQDSEWVGDIYGPGTFEQVATVWSGDTGLETALCNARLISKAPEMFEYLQTLGTPFAEDLRKFVLGVDGAAGT